MKFAQGCGAEGTYGNCRPMVCCYFNWSWNSHRWLAGWSHGSPLVVRVTSMVGKCLINDSICFINSLWMKYFWLLVFFTTYMYFIVNASFYDCHGFNVSSKSTVSLLRTHIHWSSLVWIPWCLYTSIGWAGRCLSSKTQHTTQTHAAVVNHMHWSWPWPFRG